jgi:hypothetical protein
MKAAEEIHTDWSDPDWNAVSYNGILPGFPRLMDRDNVECVTQEVIRFVDGSWGFTRNFNFLIVRGVV